MFLLLPLFFIGALLAPLVMRRGRLGFAVLALIPAVAFGWLATLIPRVAAGRPYTERIAWVPQLGMNLDVRIDALSLLLALIATGVGALVMIYSARYFAPRASYLGRFAAVFVAFAGAMLGLVTVDNTVALYIFWELTTVFSFLLIGHYSDRPSSRRAAIQALIVTTTGGLAMLAGIVMLGTTAGGSFSLHGLVSAALSGALRMDGVTTAAIVLVLAGAFSKSALIPVHFWLPAAMAAPTPVSAYLHSSAMVKAGVYLVARLAPGFAALPAWHWLVMVCGIGTLLVGGYRALGQVDIKLVIAFGTVSQLGLITLLVGYGTRAMLLAGLMLLLAHSLFKSALFLSVGIVDVATGTRDLRELSGIGRRLPWVAAFAGLADLSMMGIPPFAGFVAKEGALASLWGGSAEDWLTLVAIAAGSALTVGYGLRFWWGAFCRKPEVEDTPIGRVSLLTVTPVGILALASLAAGLCVSPLTRFLAGYANTYDVAASSTARGVTGASAATVGLAGPEAHPLHVWGGWNGPLVVTAIIIVAGVLIFAGRYRWVAFAEGHEFPISATRVYQGLIAAIERGSTHLTARYQNGSLPRYLTTIFGFLCLAIIAGLCAVHPQLPSSIRIADSWPQAVVAALGIAAAFLAARARRRLKAVLLLGVSGYAVALIFQLYGAPDLALTQVLAETLSLVVFVLVLRRLPPYFSGRRGRVPRRRRIALATVVGALFAFLAWVAVGARTAEPIWHLFGAEAYGFGYGTNVVNVTLVDVRAWDTMGETSVLVMCAVGIASLLFVRDQRGGMDRFRNLLGAAQLREKRRAYLEEHGTAELTERLRAEKDEPGRGRDWLSASWRLRDHPERRTVLLEIGTRLIYHSILVVSLFLLFTGHNAPGGGFAGGLLAGIALVLRYLAGGRFELGAALPVLPAKLLGWGLMFITLHVVAPLFFGGVPMQTVALDWHMNIFGHVHMTTALFFDIGVYLAVVGLVAEILRSLGGEVDRHGQLEHLEGGNMRIRPGEDTRRQIAEEMRGEAELRERTGGEEPGRGDTGGEPVGPDGAAEPSDVAGPDNSAEPGGIAGPGGVAGPDSSAEPDEPAGADVVPTTTRGEER